jgi:hypothetical protein
MSVFPIDEKYRDDFSILYHLTGIGAAKEILKSKKIFGRDLERHANFSVLGYRSDLARSSEVCLRFRWEGEQCLYFGDPFGEGVSESFDSPHPTIFHIFIDSPPDDGKSLESKRYWQTNVYPGVEGLVFEGLEILLQIPPRFKRPSKLKIWSYKNSLEQWEYVSKMNNDIGELKKLALVNHRQKFYVPN